MKYTIQEMVGLDSNYKEVTLDTFKGYDDVKYWEIYNPVINSGGPFCFSLFDPENNRIADFYDDDQAEAVLNIIQ